MFLRVLIGLTAVMHVPFALAAFELLRRSRAEHAALLAVLLALFGFVTFVARARSGMHDQRRSKAFVSLVDIPAFIHWCACIFTLVPSAVALVFAAGRALLLGTSGLTAGFFMWTYALGLVIASYGVLIRRRWFVVEEVEVTIDGLHASFDGYRIAHLSDLHIGATTPQSWGEGWARTANALSPDMAVVTGDLVTSGTEFHEDVAAVIGALRAKDGVFVSMGNHDYFGDGEPLVRAIEARGPRVLRNAGVSIRRGDNELYLAGIDDTWTRRDDMPLALSGRPEGAPVVLLAHDPERFREAAKQGVALVLAGHTHGGQIAVPFLSRRLSLSHLTHDFHAGLYHRGRSTLYVHPGLGTTGPPIRIGVAPAVVILTLRVR